MKKQVVLRFDLGQICNDMLAKCNLISKSIKEEAAEDIKASILTPDDPETRCIVNRAVTEAFGRVKVACQRYLTVGRLEDDNNLERLVKSVTFAKEPKQVQDTDELNRPLYLGTVAVGDNHEEHTMNFYKDGDYYYDLTEDETWTEEDFTVGPTPMTHEEMVDTDEITNIEYEVVTLTLLIPNFNLAVTDDLKSAIHKFVVDYVMAAFLQDQHADKAAEYKGLADGEDYRKIISDLNARENYTMRKPSFM